MIDSSSRSLLEEIQSKHKRILTWPITTVGVAALIALLFFIGSPIWLNLLIAVPPLFGIWWCYRYDQFSKTVVVLYDLDPAIEQAFQSVHDCALSLAHTGGKWHLNARANVYDRRYHAGASHLVRRAEASFSSGLPPYFKSNVSAVKVALSNKSLFLFPDRMLVIGPDGVGAVAYQDLAMVIGPSTFIEEGHVPNDAKIVGETWRFVNKNGTPDRRFNNNSRLPVCEYEEVLLTTPFGLHEVLQISRAGIAAHLDQALQRLADVIAAVANAPPVKEPPQTTETPLFGSQSRACTVPKVVAKLSAAADAEQDLLYDSLIDILCCLMAVDGRAASAEKKRIREIMTQMPGPWSDSEIDNRIERFLSQVQSMGYRRVLIYSLNQVQIFKELGKQSLLTRCLDLVARADGNVTERELELCQRIAKLVESAEKQPFGASPSCPE